MRKNKKIIAILTLVLFAMSMLPVAAFAAVENATLTADKTEVAGGEDFTLTATIADGEALDPENELYVVKDGSATLIEADTPFAQTAPAGTAVAQELKYELYEAVDEEAAVAAAAGTDVAALATETVTVTADEQEVINATVAADASTFATNDKDATFEIGADDAVGANIQLLNNEGKLVLDANNEVIVWAETTADEPSSALTIDGAAAGPVPNTWIITPSENPHGLDLVFGREGTYTLKAALAEGNDAITQVADFTNKFDTVADYNQVVVTKAAVATDEYVITADEAEPFEIAANGVASTKVVFTVLDKDGLPVKNTAVTVDPNSSAITTDKAEYTTNYKGEFTVKFKGTIDGNYTVTVTVGDSEEIFDAVVASTYATDIEASKTPSKPIALNSDAEDLADTLQFTVTDNNGNVLTTKTDTMYDTVNNTNSDYVTVVAPDGSNLKNSDLKLDVDTDGQYYYITLNGKKLDKEGTYTFTVALENGKKATASVEVAKFGEPVEIVVDYGVEVVALEEEVAEPEVYFLDANGVKKAAKASEYILGYTGHGVNGWTNGAFTVGNDLDLIGKTVKVTAVSDRYNLTDVATLLIGEGGTAMTFNDNKGVVDTNNREEFQIVDEDGKTAAIGATVESVRVLVSNQSNPDAKVSAVDVSNYADLRDKGLGRLSLTSDKQTTVDVEVVVETENGRLYAGNMTYTFGDTATADGLVVVMTINSNDTIVNNSVVTIDAAPFVNEDWRTMVPFRALAENFGATVEWNEEDQTVTATLDGVTVVMKIGETTYTVNGVEKTMDTAPVIKDGRTFIPVRFAAEAFGFDVTPLYAEDGTTASVAFTK